jgi:hypothetical protein
MKHDDHYITFEHETWYLTLTQHTNTKHDLILTEHTNTKHDDLTFTDHMNTKHHNGLRWESALAQQYTNANVIFAVPSTKMLFLSCFVTYSSWIIMYVLYGSQHIRNVSAVHNTQKGCIFRTPCSVMTLEASKSFLNGPPKKKMQQSIMNMDAL